MTNILIVTFYPPDKSTPSAGSKTSVYYAGHFASDPDFNVRMLTFRTGDEKVSEIDNIKIDCIEISKKTIVRIKRAFFELRWQINPFDKSAGHYYGYKKVMIKKMLEQQKDYKPDVVILEWTECVLYIDTLKKLYPKAKFVGFAHDVCFQKITRYLQHATGKVQNFFMGIRLKRFKQFEVASYKKCDHVVVQNNKDRDLLVNEGLSINNFTVVSPYYQNMSVCKPRFTNNILFWGDLRRPENYTGCIWFIENVFTNLIKQAPNIKLILAGKDAPPQLASYQSETISLTGFVKELEPVFENAFCLIAPLYLGAGIKVKILESMSASLPVLTGEVGIEGIEATDGKEYLHCDTAEQYTQAIIGLLNDKQKAKDIGAAGNQFINTVFSIERSLELYKSTLKTLAVK